MYITCMHPKWDPKSGGPVCHKLRSQMGSPRPMSAHYDYYYTVY